MERNAMDITIVEMKKRAMPRTVLGDSRMGIFTSKQKDISHYSFYNSLLIMYYVPGTQQDLQGVCLLVRKTGKQ